MRVVVTRTSFEHRRVPLSVFPALWEKKLSTEKRDTRPLIHLIFSLPELFWNTRVPLTTAFGSAKQEVFDKNTWYHPLNYSFLFHTRKFVKHNGPPDESFGTVRQKITLKPWWPLHMHDSCHHEYFIRAKEGSSKFFPALWDKKLSTEKRDTLPLIHLIFSLPELFWNTRVRLTKFFGTVCQKIRKKCDDPPPMNESFLNEDFV